jgi:hypothetical protein
MDEQRANSNVRNWWLFQVLFASFKNICLLAYLPYLFSMVFLRNNIFEIIIIIRKVANLFWSLFASKAYLYGYP